jgi:hypothetical protein
MQLLKWSIITDKSTNTGISGKSNRIAWSTRVPARITIVEDVAAEIRIARTIFLAATMRKDPKSI